MGEGPQLNIHLSLSGELNPARLEHSSAQTEFQDYSVAGTSAATERYLYIGPESRDRSTQFGPATTATASQTELTIPATATVLIIPAGTNIHLG